MKPYENMGYFSISTCARFLPSTVLKTSLLKICAKVAFSIEDKSMNGCFWFPYIGGRWYIITKLAIYIYISIRWLYITYHLLGEPETTIENPYQLCAPWSPRWCQAVQIQISPCERFVTTSALNGLKHFEKLGCYQGSWKEDGDPWFQKFCLPDQVFQSTDGSLYKLFFWWICRPQKERRWWDWIIFA